MAMMLNMQLEKYYIQTIICSECAFKFPIPEATELELQKYYSDLPGLLSMEIAFSAIDAEAGSCPCCGSPTILQIRAINKNG